MDEQAIGIFCICDEVIKCFGILDDPQCKMSTAEVATFALISATQHQGNYRTTRLVSAYHRYFSKILSHSRLVRRIHAISEAIWHMILKALQMYLRKPDSRYFIVDSFPVKAYGNHKSFRARIFREKKYHGYTASKKEYFFGIKVHMIIDQEGIPIEFCFTPGSTSDIEGLKELPCELPQGAVLFGDKAYTDYSLEDDLLEMAGISLIPKRKHNLKRQHPGPLEYILCQTRNYIETVFSSIVNKMPRYIKARTERGFYLKIFLFIMGYLFCMCLPIR